MDLWLLLLAFGFGFAANTVRLPPMVGYLAAGFALHAVGVEAGPAIAPLADVGVLLLLFGIGLKLRLGALARPVIWAGGTVHLVVTSALVGGLLLVVAATGLPLAAELSIGDAALVGFAFSFSSTVFAVKALEERNEAGALQGRLAIGILVIQDVFAVAFLTLAVDDRPSAWAGVVVVAVLAGRPLYGWVLDRSGHGELLVLAGLALGVVVGAESFALVGLKPDLGALLVGMTLAGHRRAPELAETLLSFKDILLIGFFLSIGLGGVPDGAGLAAAVIVVAILPIKTALYVAVVSAFRYRARTAWHSSITLATYSEFGLIVAVVAVERGSLPDGWTPTIAVAVAISFVLAAPLNTGRYRAYARLASPLGRIERTPVRSEDALIEPSDAAVVVFGMGRVGAGAFDELVRRRGPVVLGVDRDAATVAANIAAGRNMVRGDALDPEFWGRLRLDCHIDLVVLAMNDHPANLEALDRVGSYLPGVCIAATASHEDEVVELEHAGVDVARNLYGEAGQGLADDACDLLSTRRGDDTAPR